MGENSFKYHDKDDELTIALIDELEPYTGYWGKSEDRIIKIIDKYLEKHPLYEKSFLDVGCGDGRLLHKFKSKFSKIVGVEPDAERLESAINTAKEKNIYEKCVFLNEKIENFKVTEQFDCVLCSHIIQHVSVDALCNLFNKLKESIKDSGLLFLMTCHSTEKDDYFVKDYFRDGKIIEDEIKKPEFEEIVKSNDGILPIHFFTYHNLKKLLTDAGFIVIEYQVFHVLNNLLSLDNLIDRDSIINSFGFLKQKFGRDIFISAKPSR